MRSAAGRRTRTAVATALALTAYVYAISGGNVTALYVSQFGAVASATMWWLLILKQRNTNQALRSLIVMFTLLVILLLSASINFFTSPRISRVNWNEVVQLVGFSWFWIVFGSIAQSEEWRPWAKTTSLLLFALCLVGIAVAPWALKFGRAWPFGVHPNWWGELALATSLFSLVLGHRGRFIVISVCMVLLYFVQSRSGWLGLCVIVFIEAAFFLRIAKRTTIIPSAVLISVLVMALSAFGGWEFIAREILFLDSESRGLGSGLTGRLEGWGEAMDALAIRPVIGYGPGTFSEVHNGYLRMAAEFGLLATGIFLTLLAAGTFAASVTGNRIRLAGLLAPAAYMIVEPRAFNLNLVSLFFWMSVIGLRGAKSREKEDNVLE